ncbi:MAG: hypothetical protein BMS9Abin34_182 [Patescibacteria group bacterium]|nr:MAG: hypothetical protein BMS9Abin34_182 [Patescibacteria group bacterium]
MPIKQFFQNKLFLVLTFIFIFLAGWQVGYAGFQVNLRANPPGITVENKTPSSSTIDFSLLWDTIARINKEYLFRPVDGKKLLYGAVSGLVGALDDPYTSFLDPEQNKQFDSSLEGVYEGIGAEIGIRNDQLMIVAPLDGSPAKAVGVRAGDQILEIDGVSTVGISIVEAVSKIRGPAGAKVVLTLRRGDQSAFKTTIVRDRIQVKSVSWEEKDGGVFYLKVSRFGNGTNGEWDEAIRSIKSAGGIKGVVLDLRSNPGGYLAGAVYLASEFLEDGAVVIQEDSGGGRRTLSVQSTKNDRGLLGVSVAVLIDGGSASASEILAGVLQERAGAKLVGKKSFGKGTVQDAVDFKDGSGLHLTVAKWLTPSGRWVHEKGLEPDFEVELTEDDLDNNRDPQIDKALELLR